MVDAWAYAWNAPQRGSTDDRPNRPESARLPRGGKHLVMIPPPPLFTARCLHETTRADPRGNLAVLARTVLRSLQGLSLMLAGRIEFTRSHSTRSDAGRTTLHDHDQRGGHRRDSGSRRSADIRHKMYRWGRRKTYNLHRLAARPRFLAGIAYANRCVDASRRSPLLQLS